VKKNIIMKKIKNAQNILHVQ